MKRPVLLFLFLSAMSFNLFAAGKIYWQANGILITDRDGMVAIAPVPDGQGGVIVFTGDGMDSLFAIKVDKNGNLPWTLHGKVLDDNGFGGFQGSVKAVTDGKNGAIAVWARWYPWGQNLYYNRIDSLGNKAWAGNGVPLTLSDSTQEYHQVVSDGAGGAIAAWQEQRNGQWDIYAQRVDSNGLRQWGNYGKVVCNAGGGQQYIAIDIDSTGQCVMAWEDQRSGNYDIYAQMININGISPWDSNGIYVSQYDSIQSRVSITMNYDNIILSWNDKRAGNFDIYAQSLNNNGLPRWINNGIPVCTASNVQGASRIIIDKGNNIIDIWWDKRSGNWDIYCQKLDTLGNGLWGEKAICNADSDQQESRIISDNSSGALICWQDKRGGNYDIYAQHVDSSGNVKWQANGMAVCTTTYSQESPEMAPSDSNTAIIIWCDARSGYYRGYAQRVGDDLNGIEEMQNEKSPIANCKLNQNYPNPFKQSTVINYQLSQAGRVSLKVFNIAGQVVRTFVNEVQKVGSYEIEWEGHDDSGRRVSNGVYFYQLQIDGNIARTKKMLKIK